jgi:hypothetical protein
VAGARSGENLRYQRSINAHEDRHNARMSEVTFMGKKRGQASRNKENDRMWRGGWESERQRASQQAVKVTRLSGV